MFSKNLLSEEAICELYKIKKTEEKINRNDLIYKSSNKKKNEIFGFRKFKAIKSFGREIYSNNLKLDNAFEK